jgi:hypothetical protein
MRIRLLISTALCAAVAAGATPAGQTAVSPAQRVAWTRFNVWTVSVNVYKYDQRTYVGMTKAKLAKLDYGVLAYPVRIGWATKTRYCLEATVSGRVFHRVGPISYTTNPKIAAPAGKCPAR